MMQIYFNQEKVTLEKNMTLSDVLYQYGYAQQTFAVAINQRFVARENYASIALNEGDSIDIILPMQGG